MKITINEWDFKNEFQQIRPNNFSLQALNALWDYLEWYEEETEEEMELDIIGLCCDYSEFDDLEEFQSQYFNEIPGDKFKTIEEIEEETVVIRINDSDSFIVGTCF